MQSSKGNDESQITGSPLTEPVSHQPAGPGPATDPSSHSDHGPLDVGQPFGTRYIVIRLLGRGGMGAVYQAWDQELGVAVALKVIRPEAMHDPAAAAEMERRFKRELLLAREVTHRNVVRIHDLGEIEGIKYITMPYVEGHDLATILKREGKLSTPAALKVARQLAAGLAAAHEAGVVHRDLKPANVMVDDAEDHVLIMDFGIALSHAAAQGKPANVVGDVAIALPQGSPASALDATITSAIHPGIGSAAEAPTLLPSGLAAAEHSTFAVAAGLAAGAALASLAQGSVVGTIDYMAPEQARGEPVDHRADVYAFGLILREMLLGATPRPAQMTPVEWLQQRIQQVPASLRDSDSTISEPVDALVVRCLQLDPAARFATTGELVAALDRLDDDGQLLPEPRRLTPRLVAAVVLLMTTLVGGTWWWARDPIVTQPPPLSVLIADFENRTDDASLNGTLEQSLGIALENASFITVFPRATARSLAQQLRASPRIDEEAARLIALREGVRVVLAGAVERRGTGYQLTIRALAPDAATETASEPVASATATAGGRDDLLNAVSDLASALRDEFGDTTAASARQADIETFTSASLDAVIDYAQGQDLASAGRDDEAVAKYRAALASDPDFGRAYSGWAVSAGKLGRSDEAAEAYKKAFAVLDRMTEREKLRTLGAYYLQFAGSYDKAIENFSELVRRYPADRAGHSNLAIAYFNTLDFANAMEEGRQAIQIYPRNVTFRSNYALFAMYAGDFSTAMAEARRASEMDPDFFKAYLPVAIASIDAGQFDAADEAYERMAATGAAGASLAASGMADLELLTGRYEEARKRLRAALGDDQKAARTDALARKTVALAEAALELRRPAEARSLVANIPPHLTGLSVKVPAARILLRAGAEAEARRIAGDLSNQLQPQRRAYGRIIEAEMALARNRSTEAVELLRGAQELSDVWLGRFDLGIAYVQAGAFAEAVSELEIASKRRGEATAMFLDDWPTVRSGAALSYWLARAHEGLGTIPAARRNYEAYLKIRPAATGDLLARDAEQRLAALGN